MTFDLNLRHHYYFNEICKIPHGSGNEKGLSDYLVNFAQTRGLKYLQDEVYNVVIYKDASTGYEKAAPLLLQGHMDMVCEANKDTKIDFTKDPITLRTDGDWLMASGTTLGADDGVAVAYMLAILENDQLPHPPLECCFTIKEETGLEGAAVLKKEYFKAKRLVCLDHSGEVDTCISTSGGRRATATLPAIKVKNTKASYRLFVTGLMGGHSGNFINTGRENAIKLANRMLKEWTAKNHEVNLIKIDGGLKENAIPRECEIIFSSADAYEELAAFFKDYFAQIYEEIGTFEKDVKYTFEKVATANECFDTTTSINLINYVFLLPNGFKRKSDLIEGLTVTSLNLGIIGNTEDSFVITSSIRSVFASAKLDIYEQICTLAGIFNGKVNQHGDYAGWNYKPESKMRDYFAKALKEVSGQELKLHATHGGNECGIFSSLGVEDIIACGPIMEDIHTPRERLSISSFDRFYQILLKIMEACKD